MKLLNRFWRDFAYHRGHARVRNRPAVLAIEATNHCNLQCVMCPRGEPDLMERSLGVMTDELLERVLDQGAEYLEPLWFHWFGEPLMHPRLLEQLALIKARGVPNVGISTNATLLDERQARRLLDSPLDTLMIALDGTTPAVYERIRKSSQFGFDSVRGNVERFLELRRGRGRSRLHVTLSIIVMEETRAQLAAFREYWMARGADEIHEKPYVVWANQTTDFVPLARVEDRAALATTGRPHPCKTLWESLVITWNGLVVPCCFDYDARMVMGDLNLQTLPEIWNGEPYQEMRRRELERRNDSPLCRNCTQAPGHERRPAWPLG